MSKYAVELLDTSHDRKRFTCGRQSIDRYLKETARSHTEKGVSLSRVLVDYDAVSPKPILGYFSLTPCLVEAAGWPAVPKGLPKNPVGAILLGRMGVALSAQGQGIGSRMLAIARRITAESLTAAGGIGMIVDAGDDELSGYYEQFGFQKISDQSNRLFLPTRSLVTTKK